MTEITEKELFWLAGLLEGEGSFMVGPPSKPNLPVISLEMVDKDIIHRVSKLLNKDYSSLKSRNIKWKETYRICLYGKNAVELMKLLYPLMGQRRKNQIRRAIDSYIEIPRGKLKEQDVKEIRRRLFNDEVHSKIAADYGVNRSTITYIKTGKIWKDIQI